ncbi:MAG: hypothetical protein IKK28_01490 [Mogibacterium sp.]|nr:hypothetical protein [Mogibacterium sp.]
MKPEDVRIDDTATLLVAKRKINEIISDIEKIRDTWQDDNRSVHQMLKEVESSLADARADIMAAASLILNDEVDKVTQEDGQ